MAVLVCRVPVRILLVAWLIAEAAAGLIRTGGVRSAHAFVELTVSDLRGSSAMAPPPGTHTEEHMKMKGSGYLHGSPLYRAQLKIRASSGDVNAMRSLSSNNSLCGVGVHAMATPSLTVAERLREECPADCPLHAVDVGTSVHCDFACVPASGTACAAFDAGAPIADLERNVCRGCKVNGCAVCARGGEDKCRECSQGYQLQEDGSCEDESMYVWFVLLLVILLVALIALFWVIDLACRPETNPEGLSEGLTSRSRAKLHQFVSGGWFSGAERVLWPWYTNLCRQNVAGPAIALQFNFLAMVIFWAGAVLLGWLFFARHVDEQLLELGLLKASTPRQECIITAVGWEEQQRLMWAKVVFVFACYMFTFALFILFAIHQRWRHASLEGTQTTHMDFCVECRGLPPISGSERVEEEFQAAVEQQTRQRTVGVSMCWDMSGQEDDIRGVIDDILDERDTEPGGAATGWFARLAEVTGMQASPPQPEKHRRVVGVTPQSSAGIFTGFFAQVERIFLSQTWQKVITKGRRKDFGPRFGGRGARVVDAHQVLAELHTCNQAFVVFPSEQSRDAALATESIIFRGCQVRLKPACMEPSSVTWSWMRDMSVIEKGLRILLGFCAIALALFVWVRFFYLPYAGYVMNSNFAYGHEPFYKALMFTLVVVMGNVLMYTVCAAVADAIGFRRDADRECCYMLLYTVACTLNVALDLWCEYMVANTMLAGAGALTHDGIPIKDVSSHLDRFRAYPVQRDLGAMLTSYAFPSTFLIPFLIEPLATIYVPYKLMCWIVQSRPEIRGSTAQSFLASPPMDLSRYADVLVNVMLSVLVFFFPGGFVWMMFFGLLVGQVWIYLFDSYRLLRTVPACTFTIPRVDNAAQWLLCMPCGLLLSCAIYKGNCIRDLPLGLRARDVQWLETCHEDEFGLIVKVCAAFILHVVLHTLLLIYVVPRFGRVTKAASEESYESCARRIPLSWFSANPVHCLRSEYVYGHRPPCDFCVAGREHLLRPNPSLGCYFSASAAKTEDFAYWQRQANEAADSVQQTYGVARDAYRAADAAKRLRG